MKLVRFGAPGRERPGIWLENGLGEGKPGILDVRAKAFDIADYDSHFFGHGGLSRLPSLLKEDNLPVRNPAEVRIGPPVARPSKILCLGKNYVAHAAECGLDVSSTPVVFSKAASAMNGPFDPIVIPRETRIADGEAELAVVIGRRARRLTEENALSAVAGYLVLNDVTDREAQRAGEQWFVGKSPDTFCPMGPFFVTADEVPDPHSLRVFQRVNGETLQDASTGLMIFRIPNILAHITARTTLEPGDVVATGTPAGIGSVRNPPLVLKPGDIMEVGVEGLGTQKSEIVAESDATR